MNHVIKNPVMSEVGDDDSVIHLEASDGLQVQVDETVIRTWFAWVNLEQAADTARVVEGILEGRQAAKPKRKRRSDAGTPRTDHQRMLENT